MTLKENLTYNNLTSSKLEKIADEFAIGFAEWVKNLRISEGRDYDLYCRHSITELLQIYKKKSNYDTKR